MGKRRSNKGHTATIVELTNALALNGQAMREGPKIKTWSKHSLKSIKPLTPTQDDMFHAFLNGKDIVAHGSAGTGKSYIALYLAFNEMLRDPETYRKVIIVRSAVATRDLGFMPGTLEEKTALYEQPYRDILCDLFGRYSTYQDMKDADLITFMTTSFLRGLTWNNAIVIVDECQNMSLHEINSVMTRLGKNSRIIFTGDGQQSDLNARREKSGIDTLIQVATEMDDFSIIRFTPHDIVRSERVKSWITALERIAS